MIHDRFVSPQADYVALQDAAPLEVLQWATDSIDRLAVATSFQSSGMVILHMIRTLRPDVPVLFLDTGFHFAETLAFKDDVTRMWDLKVVELRGEHGDVAGQERLYGAELYHRDPDRCCFVNKVAPLQDALESYDGWISGLRRDQSPLRSTTPIVEAQLLPSGNEILKIHPLATWGRDEVQTYVRDHDIPTHPLLERGFASIGCWPCTRAVVPGEDERAGRWDGSAKTECGIHSFGRNGGGRLSEAEQ